MAGLCAAMIWALAIGCLARSARADYNLITLASFNGANGSAPHGGLYVDANGNLFGAAEHDGNSSTDGTMFEYVAATGTLSALAPFPGTPNGGFPFSDVTEGPDGNLYGTTHAGGTSGGTIFQFNPTTNTLRSLGSVPGSPTTGVVFDSSGNIYGTTASAVYEYNRSTGLVSTLASIPNSNSGTIYEGGVTVGSDGMLYGATIGGGDYGYGSLFKLDPSNLAYTTLASFNHTNGAYPESAPVLDAQGDLFGTTHDGGVAGLTTNPGTVYELPAGSSTVKDVAVFGNGGAQGPHSNIIFDASGTLFGTTYSNNGTVFEVNPATDTLTILAAFNGTTQGASPYADLVTDGKGNFYGTTSAGGAHSDGTIFELSPVSVPTSTHSASITNGSTGVIGGTGSSQTGGVSATFENTNGSTLQVQYSPSVYFSDLQDGSTGLPPTAPINFALPNAGAFAQVWDLTLEGGSFTGNAEVTFYYDPTNFSPGVDQTKLQIFHYVGGVWTPFALTDETINTTADTITVDTTSFSPFALGLEVASVPEPASTFLLAIGGVGLLARRRHRCAR